MQRRKKCKFCHTQGLLKDIHSLSDERISKYGSHILHTAVIWYPFPITSFTPWHDSLRCRLAHQQTKDSPVESMKGIHFVPILPLLSNECSIKRRLVVPPVIYIYHILFLRKNHVQDCGHCLENTGDINDSAGSRKPRTISKKHSVCKNVARVSMRSSRRCPGTYNVSAEPRTNRS